MATVFAIPGFGMPPSSLLALRSTLARHGHEVILARTGLNLDCGEQTAQRIAEQVLEAAAQNGGGVAVVGHSRGGQIGRVVAVRHPGAVHRLVTAATPWSVGPPHRPGVSLGTRAVRAGRRTGALRRFGSVDCGEGPCCSEFRNDLRQAPSCYWVALWSSRDRIAGVDARPPVEADRAVDTRTTHLGMITTTRGREAIAGELRS